MTTTLRMKRSRLVNITRPFALFVEQDEEGDWIAHIVGHELDNVTLAETPTDAVFMAHDLLRMLTGGCKPMDDTPHDWSIETTLSDDPSIGTPARQCSRCGEKCPMSELEVA